MYQRHMVFRPTVVHRLHGHIGRGMDPNDLRRGQWLFCEAILHIYYI